MKNDKNGWVDQTTGDWIETVGGLIGTGVED